MLRALEVEASFASQQNWSFRCESQDFEYLEPTSMMVAFPHRANAEQLFRYHPSLDEKARSHDGELSGLRQRCQAASKALLDSARFQALRIPETAGPGDRRYFAEYVVNGVRDLPAHYSFSDFWRQFGGEYLQLRADPALRPFFESLATAGASFTGRLVALRKTVKGLQARMADEAGLPAVPDIG